VPFLYGVRFPVEGSVVGLLVLGGWTLPRVDWRAWSTNR
jgi:hypothetical protein